MPFYVPILNHLKICHLRNLSEVSLTPNPRFNIIYGANASGKTSLLEAIYVLGTVRSFRTSKLQFLVSEDQSAFSVFSEASMDDGFVHRLGIEKAKRKNLQIRIDGQPISSSSHIASMLPIIALDPQSFDLLDGSPQQRRSFLNWLVFHVKPSYLNAWKDYSRCLKQRNMALRRGNITRLDIEPWDKLLARSGAVLEGLKADVVADLTSRISGFMFHSGDRIEKEISLGYQSGWAQFGAGLSVEQLEALFFRELDAQFDSDLRQGFTQKGSHRGDLLVRSGKNPAAELLSRGQKKSLIIAMYLAVSEMVLKFCNKRPIFLLDDLPSELDAQRLSALCGHLMRLSGQVFITAVSRNGLAEIQELKNKEQCTWFHVKHGSIDETTKSVETNA